VLDFSRLHPPQERQQIRFKAFIVENFTVIFCCTFVLVPELCAPLSAGRPATCYRRKREINNLLGS